MILQIIPDHEQKIISLSVHYYDEPSESVSTFEDGVTRFHITIRKLDINHKYK